MYSENIRIGTVSHGTLRPQDLAPAFLALADGIDAVVPADVREAVEAGIADDAEGADELLESLVHAIDDALPTYLRFGAHEGDGSDFGVWPQEWCDEDVAAALLAADAAADGDSNDEEIRLLRDALEMVVDMLAWRG